MEEGGRAASLLGLLKVAGVGGRGRGSGDRTNRVEAGATDSAERANASSSSVAGSGAQHCQRGSMVEGRCSGRVSGLASPAREGLTARHKHTQLEPRARDVSLLASSSFLSSSASSSPSSSVVALALALALVLVLVPDRNKNRNENTVEWPSRVAREATDWVGRAAKLVRGRLERCRYQRQGLRGRGSLASPSAHLDGPDSPDSPANLDQWLLGWDRLISCNVERHLFWSSFPPAHTPTRPPPPRTDSCGRDERLARWHWQETNETRIATKHSIPTRINVSVSLSVSQSVCTTDHRPRTRDHPIHPSTHPIHVRPSMTPMPAMPVPISRIVARALNPSRRCSQHLCALSRPACSQLHHPALYTHETTCSKYTSPSPSPSSSGPSCPCPAEFGSTHEASPSRTKARCRHCSRIESTRHTHTLIPTATGAG